MTVSRSLLVLAAGMVVMATAPERAAEPTYQLRYRYVAGQKWTCEVVTSVEGSVALRNAADPEQKLPIILQLAEDIDVSVAETRQDGAGWLVWQLRRFQIARPQGAVPLSLELVRAPDGLVIRRDDRTWAVPPSDAGKPEDLPDEAREGFGAIDPRQLIVPVRLLHGPGGEVTERQGATWFEYLARTPLLAPLAPLGEPFGANLMHLPGKAVDVGQTWTENRHARLPGDPAPYPLTLTYTLTGPGEPADPETLRIDYQGGSVLTARPFELTLADGPTIPLTLDRLEHAITGRADYAPASGRVVAQSQTSQITILSHGQNGGQPFTLESRLLVNSTMVARDATTVEPAAPSGQ